MNDTFSQWEPTAQAYFITGTDTNVGKTYVTCELIKQWRQRNHRILPLKPVASGCIQQHGQWVSEDALSHAKTLNMEVSYTPWAFEEPMAPHLAAERALRPLTARVVADWCLQAMQTTVVEVTIIEGAGGLLVPLNDKESWIDVIRLLECPVIIVIGLRLGCINHALLTEQALQAADCQIAGWIANEIEQDTAYMLPTLKQWMRSHYFGLIAYQKESSV